MLTISCCDGFSLIGSHYDFSSNGVRPWSPSIALMRNETVHHVPKIMGKSSLRKESWRINVLDISGNGVLAEFVTESWSIVMIKRAIALEWFYDVETVEVGTLNFERRLSNATQLGEIGYPTELTVCFTEKIANGRDRRACVRRPRQGDVNPASWSHVVRNDSLFIAGVGYDGSHIEAGGWYLMVVNHAWRYDPRTPQMPRSHGPIKKEMVPTAGEIRRRATGYGRLVNVLRVIIPPETADGSHREALACLETTGFALELGTKQVIYIECCHLVNPYRGPLRTNMRLFSRIANEWSSNRRLGRFTSTCSDPSILILLNMAMRRFLDSRSYGNVNLCVSPWPHQDTTFGIRDQHIREKQIAYMKNSKQFNSVKALCLSLIHI